MTPEAPHPWDREAARKAELMKAGLIDERGDQMIDVGPAPEDKPLTEEELFMLYPPSN